MGGMRCHATNKNEMEIFRQGKVSERSGHFLKLKISANVPFLDSLSVVF